MIYLITTCTCVLLYLLIQSRGQVKIAKAKEDQLQRELDSQVEAQKELHGREIQRLLDALPYAFFTISDQGKIIRRNLSARKIFKQQDLTGHSIQQVFLDPPIVTEIKKVITQPSSYRRIFRLPPSSLFSEKSKGKDSHWEIDLRSISIGTDTREIQLMMRDMTTNVETDQIRQDFVANASHELRTPLSIISGYLENLTEEGGIENKEIAQKMLATMERHVVRINHIVEHMLLISKLESEEATPLKLTTFDLADCVRDIIERLDLVIGKQKATVINEVPELEIIGDHFYWTQVLFNLVENALKQNAASPVTVTISARKKKSGDLIIKVSDQGSGIPSRDLPFIFKRFFRVEKHHSQTQIKGTGLGLSIVKRAIEAHGGKITVTSIPNVETTFTIRAPQPPICENDQPTDLPPFEKEESPRIAAN